MALVVGLIMLVMMTLIAVVSYNLAKTSLDIVGNQQAGNQATVSANSAIEEALSTIRMFQSPDAVFLVPCTNPNTRCYDVNDDGTDDITVALIPQPVCIQWQNIPNAALDFTQSNNAECGTSVTQQFGIEGVATGNSLCANSLWEINAVATDTVTESQITVTAGAAVRVAQDDVVSSCP